MIHIGTSGFSFPDWQGTVYPVGLTREQMLPYYAQTLGFTAVELNFTYYALPASKVFSSMIARVPAGFIFTVKAFKGLTHDVVNDRRQLCVDWSLLDRQAASIEPLRQAGRLGALLFQFSPVFFPNKETVAYIAGIRERLTGMPLAIEFRNQYWNDDHYAALLRRLDIALCCVDEPKLPRLMPFVNRVTSGNAYFRFHGRNPHWFRSSLAERYNYLYAPAELQAFVPDVRQAAQSAAITYVFFNNCHLGYAAKNAASFQQLLAGPNR